MKVGLLYSSKDFKWKDTENKIFDDRFYDLEMEHVLDVMSGGDEEIFEICRQVIDKSLQTKSEILYRQEILKDCIKNSEAVINIYKICVDTVAKRNNAWYGLSMTHSSTIFSNAIELLKIYMEALVDIRKVLERESFSSEGMRRFSDLIIRELSDDYLKELKSLKEDIDDRDSIIISAEFGDFLQGISYAKCRKEHGFSRLQWLILPSYTVSERDVSGTKDIEDRVDRAVNKVADSTSRAAENLERFVNQLRKEISFYVGAVNLFNEMNELNLPICFPLPLDENRRVWEDLCDVSLALMTKKKVIGNYIESNDKKLYLITGANQGGKTTFLRSVGQCQLMAQSGLFVCAKKCEIPINKTVYTHFKREEDEKMSSGKLDEELERMSNIIDEIKTGSLLLSNESFSSTNDLEGSEIFEQITDGLIDSGVEVFSVTHLVNYADLYADKNTTMCLRAQRSEDGKRTFRLVNARPLKTAYGEDIYNKIFTGGLKNEN